MHQNLNREAIHLFQKTPSLFYEKVLGATLEDYQAKSLQTIADNSRTVISSCHNLGKSWLTARLVLWFGSCFPNSKIITTAPTHLQVKNILWSELRTAHSKALLPLGGELNLTEWKLDTDWFALGFTPRNELTNGEGQGTASSFQGFHAQGGLLVIFDEATGIPHNIWTMAEGLLTQANVKFVAIGNPTSRSSEFFKCFKSPEWSKVYLSCFDSPNLVENGIHDMRSLENEFQILRESTEIDAQERMRGYKVVRPYLLSTSWVMGRALKWGLKHPLFLSKVLGQFPEEGDNTLIPLGVVEEAQYRVPIILPSDRKTMGVDVARFGTDLSVLTYLNGPQFMWKKTLAKRDTMEVAGEVIAASKELGWPDVIVIDETGIGSGVVDALNQYVRDREHAVKNIEIRGVQFGAAPQCEVSGCDHKIDCDKAKYVNLKAKMFGLLTDSLRSTLSLPSGLEGEIYLDELPTILYAYDSKGRMVIESKDDYKRRTGRSSPDHADSLALANYGRFDELNIGTFVMAQNAPTTRASGFRGKSW